MKITKLIALLLISGKTWQKEFTKKSDKGTRVLQNQVKVLPLILVTRDFQNETFQFMDFRSFNEKYQGISNQDDERDDFSDIDVTVKIDGNQVPQIEFGFDRIDNILSINLDYLKLDFVKLKKYEFEVKFNSKSSNRVYFYKNSSMEYYSPETQSIFHQKNPIQ